MRLGHRLSTVAVLAGVLMTTRQTRAQDKAATTMPSATTAIGAATAVKAATKRAGATTPATPTRGDVLPFKATEKTLPNGLKVIVVPTGFPNLVSLQIPVQTGSRNEVEAGKSGFAHFFEHMMFRGTKAYPPEKYQAILTQAGARQNAYTTDDYTNYHTTFAKEDLETILAIEADRFQNLSYPEAAFKTEARAILGEYNKNSADPVRKLLEVQRDHAYTAHTYKHTTMGFLKDIEDMPNQYAYSLAFFDRWYRPEYTTLIIAGDVEPAPVLRLVEKYWGGWKRGRFKVTIPNEPAPTAPVTAHVDWPTPTLPWVTVAFRAPAFSETAKDYAATDLLVDLTFGETSDVYKKLVEEEQVVDTLEPYYPEHADPFLMTILARLKKPEDAPYVRDVLLRACAAARVRKVDAQRLADAQSHARYALARTFDNTETIAATLARFVRFRRSFDTLNALFRVYDTLTPDDLLAAARTCFTDERLVLTTLSNGPLPEGTDRAPHLASLEAGQAAGASDLRFVRSASRVPQVDVKLLFTVGSAHDPQDRPGLAALTAAMVAEAGSQRRGIDEIKRALFPIAGSFEAQVDREMTTFTARVHPDNWDRFADIVLPMLLEPGLREDDFRRLKDAQRNFLRQELRSDNEEELAKEVLQAHLFAGTPYGHPTVGTLAGIDAITLDDVRAFRQKAYTRAALTVGLSGDVPPEVEARLRRDLARLPAGPALPAPEGVVAHQPERIEVEIVQKDTRAAAISLGHPLSVTRAHPDFAALSVARSWLGEHRSSLSHLYERLRELRGMNYGDYAYIEAFPRGMYQMQPDANVARRAQLFEIWIRPVPPEQAHMALRIALFELQKLIDNGLTEEQFQATRAYLMKNAYLLTATQDRELGYALDSQWFGIGDFVTTMREKLKTLTRDDINRAIRKHLSSRGLAVVMVTKDAQALRDALTSDAFSSIQYTAEKPPELLEEDRVIGGLLLGIRPDDVKITPVEDVFAR